MDLGENLSLLGIQPSLKTVYYFENTEHGKNSSPHFHIAVPTTDGNYILLVMLTSQISKRIEYYELTNEKALQSLIQVEESTLCFLTKDSLIDCNNPIYKTREELSVIIKDLQYRNADLTDEFITSIKEAIKSSPIVRRNIKKVLI